MIGRMTSHGRELQFESGERSRLMKQSQQPARKTNIVVHHITLRHRKTALANEHLEAGFESLCQSLEILFGVTLTDTDHLGRKSRPASCQEVNRKNSQSNAKSRDLQPIRLRCQGQTMFGFKS